MKQTHYPIGWHRTACGLQGVPRAVTTHESGVSCRRCRRYLQREPATLRMLRRAAEFYRMVKRNPPAPETGVFRDAVDDLIDAALAHVPGFEDDKGATLRAQAMQAIIDKIDADLMKLAPK